jgi:hypothetical protein
MKKSINSLPKFMRIRQTTRNSRSMKRAFGLNGSSMIPVCCRGETFKIKGRMSTSPDSFAIDDMKCS